jgi:hypothetical protein
VSSHKLSRSYALFVSQLSSISIHSNVQEALADPKWTAAMVEEMTSLEEKKQHLGCCNFTKREENGGVQIGILQLNTNLMEQLIGIKHD